MTKRQHDKKRKWQNDKKTKRQKEKKKKKKKKKKRKKDKDQKKSLILSGQFRTLAMFFYVFQPFYTFASSHNAEECSWDKGLRFLNNIYLRLFSPSAESCDNEINFSCRTSQRSCPSVSQLLKSCRFKCWIRIWRSGIRLFWSNFQKMWYFFSGESWWSDGSMGSQGNLHT